MAKIIVIGSINMDVVSRVAAHPKIGETVKGEDFRYIAGGKGANQAVAASRLDGVVFMAGKVGSDAFGKQLRDFLANEKLNVGYVSSTDKVPTGAAFVAVDDAAENVIYVSGGANDNLTPDDLSQVELESGDIVSATLETPIETTKAIFERAKKVGATTVLNAAPAILGAQKLFELTDYLIVNETELAVFSGSAAPDSPTEVPISIAKLHTNSSVVIATLGKQGAAAVRGKEVVFVSGHKVNAVDTTAAGDCFVGAFIVALQEEKSLKDGLIFANAASALSVQKLGASTSLPHRNDVEQFMHGHQIS